MRESRDRLAGLLWSETETAKAQSLRQTLHISGDNRRRGRTDLDDLLASVESGDPADRLMSEGRITNELLPGYDDIDPSFGAWLRVKRESIRQSLIQGLEDRHSDGLVSARCRKRTAWALLQLDRTNEVGCRGLMRAFMDTENAAGVLAVYGQLWSSLEKDYDIEPSAATQELAVAIKNGTYPTH
jgi:DNA-binding SARP family transcriptional activator